MSTEEADLFNSADEIENITQLGDQERTELMKLAVQLRSCAESIDRIVKRKRSKDVDDNGEPTFRFAAKVQIPQNFYLTKRLVAYASSKGFDDAGIKRMLDEFIRYYNKSGVKWMDWSRVWYDWVSREVKRQSGSGRHQTWR